MRITYWQPHFIIALQNMLAEASTDHNVNGTHIVSGVCIRPLDQHFDQVRIQILKAAGVK